MRFQPGSTVIMLNTIRTYPNRVISTYDTQKAIDLLEAHGVTDYAVIERKETLPGSMMYGTMAEPWTHREVYFTCPDGETQARLLPALTALVERGKVDFSYWHPNAHLVFNAADRLALGLEVAINDSSIDVETRNGGDIGEGEASREDIDRIRVLVREMKKELPGLQGEIDILDEWVVASFPFSEMDQIEAAPVSAAPRPKL
jgi:hypothetical protein